MKTTKIKSMNWETFKLHSSISPKSITVSKHSFRKGIGILKSLGFIQCPNKKYFQKGKEIAHFNSLTQRWYLTT